MSSLTMTARATCLRAHSNPTSSDNYKFSSFFSTSDPFPWRSSNPSLSVLLSKQIFDYSNNMFTNKPLIFHLTRWNKSQHTCFPLPINRYNFTTSLAIPSLFWLRRRKPWNRIPAASRRRNTATSRRWSSRESGRSVSGRRLPLPPRRRSPSAATRIRRRRSWLAASSSSHRGTSLLRLQIPPIWSPLPPRLPPAEAAAGSQAGSARTTARRAARASAPSRP